VNRERWSPQELSEALSLVITRVDVMRLSGIRQRAVTVTAAGDSMA
jgi:hypothetical protein